MMANKDTKQSLSIFRKTVDFSLWLLFIIGCLLIGFFAIKLFLIFLSVPILTIYNAAYNFYAETGNADMFKIASSFAKNYIQSWVFLILGFMLIFFRKVIKNKMEQNG